MRISEKYSEQILKSKRDRNLKADHHGVLVKNWNLRRVYSADKGEKLYGEIVIQTPFIDISARELTNWVKETFPRLSPYIRQKVPYYISKGNIKIEVMYLGPDKYSKKPNLLELHLRINATEYLDNLSIDFLQKFLHFASTSEISK